MIWRFTIIDRNNVATVIDEPTGWDANTSEIKRDLDWHGILFTNQGETFSFDGRARQLLKDEYDQYGIEGQMTLVMEEDCGNGLEEFCRGRFMFKDYEFVCGNECYVKMPVETVKETRDLRNRLNQKVNLETAFAFDETTPLPQYSKLPFDLEIPSKGILLKNKAINERQNSTPVTPSNHGFLPSGSPSDQGWWGMITPGFTKTISAEIGNFVVSEEPLFTQMPSGPGGGHDPRYFQAPGINATQCFIYPPDLTDIINCGKGVTNYELFPLTVNLDIRLYGKIKHINTRNLFACAFYLYRQNKDGALSVIYQEDVVDYTGLPQNNDIDYFINYSNSNFVLNPGDLIYMFFSLSYTTWRPAIENNLEHFEIICDAGNYLTATVLSHTPATTSKVFAVNEVLSRIAESITNDNLRAYSEYFGRTDSQPYSHAADGCGSLEVITDGIRIRKQENRIAGKPSVFSLSLQDIFEGLNPIHNIGMGVESDPNRIGYNRLRVEPWQYFYNSNVIMDCADAGKITRKMYESEVFSTFQFGYAKWEAEEYTGLDEFLTKRTYRTTLSQVKNDLVKLSKFIASGYALEITRRKGDNDSKDWRYDKDAFIICCRRAGTAGILLDFVNYLFNGTTYTIFLAEAGPSLANVFAAGGTVTVSGALNNGQTYTISNVIYNPPSSPGGNGSLQIEVTTPFINLGLDSGGVTLTGSGLGAPLAVELGNVLNPQNIIDPSTLYNYRISPVRNAMRWMNRVLESYRQFNTDAKIIFTDGDANYYAAGEMEDPDCKLENGSLVENETIDLTIFADPANAQPFLRPERVTFEYPMSSKDYKLIEANPYGLIHFSSDCEDGYGWIDSIQYKPEEGKATFTLIPKAN